MEKIRFVLFIFLLGLIPITAQVEEKTVTLETATGSIEGTLLLPLTPENLPVVLIISGSGPTDRDGNNPIMKNNSLKCWRKVWPNKVLLPSDMIKEALVKAKKPVLQKVNYDLMIMWMMPKLGFNFYHKRPDSQR